MRRPLVPPSSTRFAARGRSARARLRAVPLTGLVGRPLTGLYGLLARWREAFALPRWRVEVAWLPGLLGERGEPSVLVLFPPDRLARIAVDAEVDDDAAERALLCALAELQLRELGDLCVEVAEAHEGRRGSPRAARSDADGPTTA